MSTETQTTRASFWGALPIDGQQTRFRVWAPAVDRLHLELDRESRRESIPMTNAGDGYFVTHVEHCPPGTLYQYRLPEGRLRPDPASRFLPEGVHGRSQVVAPDAYRWNDSAWKGVAREDLVVYEAHVGAWTAEGTYRAAIGRLDELAELGVTAIELMPLAQAAGVRNWGYDGVALFAPNFAYGTPDDLRKFVDAAHQRGLAVLVDVVYNHFGPEGNYWGEFGPYLSERHSTPWGAAPNFDGAGAEPLREFFVANAAYWIEEFHFDGLRIDAAQCIRDESPRHILAEISDGLAEVRQHAGRTIHLIAESNVYDPNMLRPTDAGGLGCDALWCDDFLHSAFAILRPGDHMSARQYLAHSDFDATLRRGYVFRGTFSEPRQRIPLEPAEGDEPVPIDRLMAAIQNHDFIGNHPQGRRLHQLTSVDAQKAATAVLLLYPAIPMLFMGEEFAAEAPFFFFVDFQDEHLREAVEQGRRAEYPQHDWTDVETPLSEAALERSKIGRQADGDRSVLQWYRRLLQVRRDWRSSGIWGPAHFTGHWDAEGHFAHLAYRRDGQQRFVVARLHPQGEFPRRIRLSGAIELSACNHCEWDEEQGVWTLGEFGVAIGQGEPELRE